MRYPSRGIRAAHIELVGHAVRFPELSDLFDGW
jgi:hypothetical protein